MTEEEIWAEYYATPITPEGLARRLELLDMIQPPSETEAPPQKAKTKQPRKKNEDDEEIPPNAAATERPYYHGHTRAELARLIALREAGIVIDVVWHRDDPASGVRLRRIRLAPPIKCRPIPQYY